jgi:hypothetical protein
MPSERMSLYDISTEGLEIERILTENEGELTPELEERLNELMRQGPERIEAAAMVVKGLEASSDACQKEVKRLTERIRGLENNADRLKRYIAFALDAAFAGKVRTERFTVWTQKGRDTVAFDLDESRTLETLDPAYVRVKRELDKLALKDAYERGIALPDGVFVDKREGSRFTMIR